MGKIQSGTNSKSNSINSASQNAKRQEMTAKVNAMKIQLDKLTNEYNSLEDNVKWNKMQMDKAEKDCYDINVKFKLAIAEYTKAEVISIKSGSTIKDKNETEAANTRMYAIKQKAREICENYDSLKDKYMKSVNEMNSLKVKISDLRAKYNTASASVGGGGGSGGSFLSPIINIFFGDDANRDCSGQLGCGNGIDYSFPSPFNSSVGGKFTPQPFESGIRL
jgi:predicted  nucleic acid-binding Zn-ribbon protein